MSEEIEITLGGETLITKIVGRQLQEKGNILLKGLEKELERKRFTLKHLSSASGMFYNWIDCECCEYPKVEIIGRYKTVRYGMCDEYNIHYPKGTIELGKIKYDGREYTVHLAGLRIIAIYNNHIQGIGWTTVISQVIDQVNSWDSAVYGIKALLREFIGQLRDYKTKKLLILSDNAKELLEQIIKYLEEKEQEIERERKTEYLNLFD